MDRLATPPRTNPNQNAPKPLSQLEAGSRGVIVRIDEADHAMLIRLKTMGMHEGRALRVVRGGSRIIVSCGGTRVGLSAEVAKHVRVAPNPS